MKLQDFKIKKSSYDIRKIAQQEKLVIGCDFYKKNIDKLNLDYENFSKNKERIENIKLLILNTRKVESIIIDKEKILKGKHIFEAMKELEFDEVPVLKIITFEDYISSVILFDITNKFQKEFIKIKFDLAKICLDLKSPKKIKNYILSSFKNDDMWKQIANNIIQ